MFKKTLTTIIATVTALAITALPVSAAEPGYVTVGDAAHGYVDVPADWHQDTNTYYYANGTAYDQLAWDSADGMQSIALIRENVPSNGLSEQESIANLCSWVGDQIVYHPDEHLNADMGDAGTIAGHKAFWASWTTPGQYMTGGLDTKCMTYYFVDDNYIYNIAITAAPTEDITPALQAATTFHF